jgi:hypothetical protein
MKLQGIEAAGKARLASSDEICSLKRAGKLVRSWAFRDPPRAALNTEY